MWPSMGSDRVSSYFTRNNLKPSLSVPCPPTGSGRLRCGHLPSSIGILAAHEKATPRGTASAIGRTESHLAVWTRCVRGAGVPRRSVIIDRRFMLACLCQRSASLDSALLPVVQTTNRRQMRSSLLIIAAKNRFLLCAVVTNTNSPKCHKFSLDTMF
jgi:hypothetical protein